MSDTCRKCNAPIVFIRTERGSLAPCDPSPVPISEYQPDANREKITGFDEAGRVIRGHRPEGREPVVAEVLISHFATCPEAKSFRGPPRITNPRRARRAGVGSGK